MQHFGVAGPLPQNAGRIVTLGAAPQDPFHVCHNFVIVPRTVNPKGTRGGTQRGGGSAKRQRRATRTVASSSGTARTVGGGPAVGGPRTGGPGGNGGGGKKRDSNWQHSGWVAEARSHVLGDRKRKLAQEQEFAAINGADAGRVISSVPAWPFPSSAPTCAPTSGHIRETQHLSRGQRLQTLASHASAPANAAKRPRTHSSVSPPSPSSLPP